MKTYISTNWKLNYTTTDKKKLKSRIDSLVRKGKKSDYIKVGKTFKVYVRKD